PGSAYTPVRGLMAWNVMSPTAIAMRYDGIASCISKRYATMPCASGFDTGPCAADITATSPFGTRTVASYVTRTCGESCSGIQLRACTDSDCENRYGSFFPFVCTGVSHCKPDACGSELYSMRMTYAGAA